MHKLKLAFSVIILFFSIRSYGQTKSAYDFKLKDSNGKTVKLSDFKGKVVVLDFWFTGCINCMNFYRSSLSNAERHYWHNSDVIFISVCIDKDKSTWLTSLKKGLYTSDASVNLYTGGLGDRHPVIKSYQITTYPQPIIINKTGGILSRSDNLIKSDFLIKTINNALDK